MKGSKTQRSPCSPSDTTIPSSTKKNFTSSRNKAMSSVYSKTSESSLNIGTQRKAYSLELESFIDGTLKMLAKKIAYKNSLKAKVSDNIRQSTKITQEITELNKANSYLDIKLKRVKEQNIKLEPNKRELEELFAVLNEKIRKTSFDMKHKLITLKNTQDNLNIHLSSLNEKLERVMREKAMERIQLKKDIDEINNQLENSKANLQATKNEITRSKTNEYQHLRKVIDNFHLLNTLSEHERIPIDKTTRAKSIRKILKTG